MAARTRTSLDDATMRSIVIHLIASEGVDAVTVPRIATAGGCSASVVYRRYDSGIDAIQEVWANDVHPHFQHLMRAAVAWGGGDAGHEAAWLRRELVDPTPLTHAVINVIAASRRLAFIGDDIRAQMEDELTSITSLDLGRPPVMSTALLLPVLGGLFLGALSADLGPIVVRQFANFADEYANPAHWSVDSGDFRYTPPAPARITTGDETLDDLHNAAVRVIIRYGYAGATATRLAREAQRSLTSAYRRVGNKDALLLSTVSAALAGDLGLSGAEASAAMSFPRDARLQRSLQAIHNQTDDRNRSNRTFVLELLLAARVDHEVRTVMAPWFASVAQRFRTNAASTSPDHSNELTERWLFRVLGGVGGMLLSFTVPRFQSRLDPAPIVSANDAAAFDSLRREPSGAVTPV